MVTSQVPDIPSLAKKRCSLCGATRNSDGICSFVECKDPLHDNRIELERDMQTETVNHPAHYGGDVPHEVWKCLEAWGLHLNAYLWTTVKYIARAGKKDQSKYVEDLKKARWYLEKEIERNENRNA